MARQKIEGTTPTEEKKVKITPFMNASRIIRQASTLKNEQLQGLAELCIERIDDDTLLNTIAEKALQRVDDIRQSLIAKQKAIIEAAQAKIIELEGKKSQ